MINHVRFGEKLNQSSEVNNVSATSSVLVGQIAALQLIEHMYQLD